MFNVHDGKRFLKIVYLASDYQFVKRLSENNKFKLTNCV